MRKLSDENRLNDLPDLNRFRIGDQVVIEASAENERIEGIIVGIELQWLYGDDHLTPNITVLHDGYLTDGFKPVDCRQTDPSPQTLVKGDEVERKLEERDQEIKRLNRIATDRRYMMDAYKAMLGPIALQVVKHWEDKGVTRQHTSWGPEAHKLTGEERAQILLDVQSAASLPLEFNDSSVPRRSVREFLSEIPSPQTRESAE